MIVYKVLVCGEFSQIHSGYAIYGRELLNRLSRTPGVEVAEMASLCGPEEPKIAQCNWRVYPVTPSQSDKSAIDNYLSNPLNAFGREKFGDVCLSFKPTHVCSFRDSWHDEYAYRHALRPYYAHVIMPAIDAIPQHRSWIDMYATADKVLSYTDWGCDVLREAGLKNVYKSASPCSSSEYRPYSQEDKQKLKDNIGLGDINIVGTVMRNQGRKLFPDLFKAFSDYIIKFNDKKTYLLCHTSYPDSWEFDELLHEHGIQNRVLFTYSCRKCENLEVAFYSGAKRHCKKCNSFDSTFTRIQNGASNETLNMVYNMMDVYAQYASCLGVGEKVYTDHGWMPIDGINIGDNVLSHKNTFRKVLKKFETPVKNKLVKEVSISGDYEKLIITDEHPFLAYTRDIVGGNRNRSVRENFGTLLRLNKDLPEPRFIELKNLRNGDMILSPIPESKNVEFVIDLSEFKTKNCIETDSTHQQMNTSDRMVRDSFIKVDNNLAKVIGLFVADGSSSGGRVQFTSHENESDIRKLIVDTFTKIGYKCFETKYKDRLARNTSIYNTKLNMYFAKYCLKKEHKKLPDEILDSTIDIQRSALQGLVLGDGHYDKRHKVYVYVTISEKLAEQTKLILKRLKHRFNCRLSKRDGNRRDIYRFEIYSDPFDDGYTYDKSKSYRHYNGNYEIVKIRDIKDVEYKHDYVYNIEVEEDNSYVTKVGIVHNCEGYGIPIAEASSCGLPVMATDYSAMSDIIQKCNGTPIKVKAFRKEPETGRMFAVPDGDDFGQKLHDLFSLPKSDLVSSGEFSRLLYGLRSYDDTANVWLEAIKNTRPRLSWDSPNRNFKRPNIYQCKNMDNLQFVKFLINEVLQEPSLNHSYIEARLIRDLTNGYAMRGFDGKYYHEDVEGRGMTQVEFSREIALKHFLTLLEDKTNWETRRVTR